MLFRSFEQPVCYEGIQKLCFNCGRLGHRKEICPYTICQDTLPREGSTVDADEKGDCSCEEHEQALIGQVRGPVGSCMRVGKKVCRKVYTDLG